MALRYTVVLAASLALTASGLHAQSRDPYWTCVDTAGNKVTRDEPCREGERQVLTNDTSAPKKRASSRRATDEPATAATAPEGESPTPLARAAAAARSKDPKVLVPFALFSIFGIAALVLWRRRVAGSAAADRAYAAAVPYTPAPAGGAGNGWSANLIRDLDKKHFEELVTGYWQAKGYRVQVNRTAANGDDLLLYEPKTGQLHAVAHCQALRNEQISVSLVRQLWGATQAHRVESGLLYVVSSLTPDAQAFMKKHKHLRVVAAEGLLSQVWTLPRDQQGLLLNRVTSA